MSRYTPGRMAMHGTTVRSLSAENVVVTNLKKSKVGRIPMYVSIALTSKAGLEALKLGEFLCMYVVRESFHHTW